MEGDNSAENSGAKRSTLDEIITPPSNLLRTKKKGRVETRAEHIHRPNGRKNYKETMGGCKEARKEAWAQEREERKEERKKGRLNRHILNIRIIYRSRFRSLIFLSAPPFPPLSMRPSFHLDYLSFYIPPHSLRRMSISHCFFPFFTHRLSHLGRLVAPGFIYRVFPTSRTFSDRLKEVLDCVKKEDPIGERSRKATI